MSIAMTLQGRRTLGLWIVLGLCLVASTIVAVGTRRQISQDLVQTQDVVTGLIYFLEEHDGRFPGSPEEFLASDFVESRADGTLVIHPRAGTRYRDQTSACPISSLDPFRIRWGTDMTSLHIDEFGKLRDDAGREVELARWPASPPSARKYSVLLAGISEKLRELAAQHAAAASMPAATSQESAPTGP